MEIITTLYSGLMALISQFDGQDQTVNREERMKAATEVCLTRRIELDSFIPSAEQCYIQLSGGVPILKAVVNGQSISHELTKSEVNALTKILGNEELKSSDKQQRLASIVGHIVIGEQASMSYNQEMRQGELQAEMLKMN